MKNQKGFSITLAAILLVASNFVARAGCDNIADKNLLVADGMSTEQIRKLIQTAESSVGDKAEQASNASY